MARPRESATILQMKGAFDKNPDRARADLPGAGPMATEPPPTLTGEEIAAWRYIYERCPLPALSSSEEIALEQAARALAMLRKINPIMIDVYAALDRRLQTWLAELGMGVKARAALGAKVGKPGGNKFGNLTPSDPAG
ncbi:MAG TPA: hypothetical protein VN660_13630 [Steroidobacteraceae bacterium]|nr:hypothetical protein [Steroidobacteraceae bacterium]